MQRKLSIFVVPFTLQAAQAIVTTAESDGGSGVHLEWRRHAVRDTLDEVVADHRHAALPALNETQMALNAQLLMRQGDIERGSALHSVQTEPATC